MAGIRVTNFLGRSPKQSPELLPETAAQVARNCKLYSGDLIPYPEAREAADTGLAATIRRLYALRDPANDPVWLAWTTDVDIAIATQSADTDQRFYYSGDGVPKVSDYSLATGGAAPFPVASYDLGLPIPDDALQLSTSAAPAASAAIAQYSRDAGSVATIITSSPHGLRSGNIVNITGFTYISGTYSRTGTTITVDLPVPHGLAIGAQVYLTFISGTAATGFFDVATVPDPTDFTVEDVTSGATSGTVRLSVTSFNATNVEVTVIDDTTLTYFSPGPEVTTLLVPSVAKVELSGLTQARAYVFTWYTPWEEESIASKPSENLFIREGQIVTVTDLPTAPPSGNNFIRGVRLYRTISTPSDAEYFLLATLWFPVQLASVQRTGGGICRVTTVEPHNLSIDDVFKISGCTDASFDITDGVVNDVIDPYTFIYTLVGVNTPETAVAAGTLYHDVSEVPGETAARYWGDADYDFIDDFDSTVLLTALESDEYEPPPEDLQGLVSLGNNVLAGFVGNELYFSEINKPHAWPRAYRRIIADNIVGVAVIGGALFVMTDAYPYMVTLNDPAAGISVARIDVRYPCVSKQSIVTMPFGVVYASHDGLVVFSPYSSAQLLTKEEYNSDTWNAEFDPSELVAISYQDMYLASHTGGSFVYMRDQQRGMFVDLDQIFTAAWYDTISNNMYLAVGDAGLVYEWNDLAEDRLTLEWKSKVLKTQDMINLGAARVIADFANPGDEVIFRLWVNKQLRFTRTVTNDALFRLPTGYRSDTFEVGVETNLRVRALHMAETPLGLKEV